MYRLRNVVIDVYVKIFVTLAPRMSLVKPHDALTRVRSALITSSTCPENCGYNRNYLLVEARATEGCASKLISSGWDCEVGSWPSSIACHGAESAHVDCLGSPLGLPRIHLPALVGGGQPGRAALPRANTAHLPLPSADLHMTNICSMTLVIALFA
jgi:hypothetical protein